MNKYVSKDLEFITITKNELMSLSTLSVNNCLQLQHIKWKSTYNH